VAGDDITHVPDVNAPSLAGRASFSDENRTGRDRAAADLKRKTKRLWRPSTRLVETAAFP
jgi:hypothetical protein